MANIVILLPRENMVDKTKEALHELNLSAYDIKVIETSNAVNEARNAINEGAHLVVARGLQAHLISKYTKIPLVSIPLTTSDFAIMLDKAKSMVKKNRLKIAMIGYKTTINDSYNEISKIMNVDLSIYYVDDVITVSQMFDQTLKEHFDVIIGGDQVMALCKINQIPGIFYESSKEAIKNALSVAKKMSFSIDVEKIHLSQFEALLESSYNHIYQIDMNHKIVLLNQVAENYLKSIHIEYFQKPIESIFEEINVDFIDRIFNQELEVFNQILMHQGQSFNISVLPIKTQEACTGAMVSMVTLNNQKANDAHDMQKSYLNASPAKTIFTKIKTNHWKYKEIIDQARMFSMSKFPITLISSLIEDGEMLSESIHNHSFRNHGPYVKLYSKQERDIEHLLFSKNEGKNLLERAHNGTLVIYDYEVLSKQTQMKLLFQMRTSTSQDLNTSDHIFTDVRYIFVSEKTPEELFKSQIITQEFFQMIHMYVLQIPKLNERLDDLKQIVSFYIDKYNHQYHRYIQFDDDALSHIYEKNWTGDLSILSGFIERIILSVKKKQVDLETVDYMYQLLFPQIDITQDSQIKKSDEQQLIESLLIKYNGNRQQIANQLKMSTTTLWRKMKQFNLS